MKNIYIIIVITLLISCSKDHFPSSSNYNENIEFNKQSVTENLGIYSSIFYGENPDASISIGYNDNILTQNRIKLGVYLWDKYKNCNPKSSSFQFGNKTFIGRKAGVKTIFVPEGVKSLQFKNNSSWLYQSNDLVNKLNSEVKLGITIEDKTIFEQNIYFPPVLNMSLINGKTSTQFPSYSHVERANIKIKWNASQSTNGVLILMRSTGQTTSNVFEKSNESVFRFMLLEDDGEETLPVTLFDGVVEGSFVECEIWRGDGGTYIGKDQGKIDIHIFSTGGLAFILD